tara:strand:+ start:3334 stop:3804 length:471 start_codon:yes stop_codon:yes gene_type:complete
MKTKRPNPRLVKIHRNYTVEEIACLFGIHKNTVRSWIKMGLPVTDNCRPQLILGSELAAFLGARRNKNKRSCTMDELYCLRCRCPQKPEGNMAYCRAVTDKVGNLEALCPVCEAIMNKRVSLAALPQICAQIDITFEQPLKHIGDSNQPNLNSDFK